jgi:hypothetical protein
MDHRRNVGLQRAVVLFSPSDTAELPLRFNGGFWGCFVRMSVDSIQPPKPFQAEYEGSIPFTRSSFFKDLARRSDFILTNRLLYTF